LVGRYLSVNRESGSTTLKRDLALLHGVIEPRVGDRLADTLTKAELTTALGVVYGAKGPAGARAALGLVATATGGRANSNGRTRPDRQPHATDCSFGVGRKVIPVDAFCVSSTASRDAASSLTAMVPGGGGIRGSSAGHLIGSAAAHLRHIAATEGDTVRANHLTDAEYALSELVIEDRLGAEVSESR
jgi:hypothetical protein